MSLNEGVLRIIREAAAGDDLAERLLANQGERGIQTTLPEFLRAIHLVVGGLIEGLMYVAGEVEAVRLAVGIGPSPEVPEVPTTEDDPV